MGIILIFQNSLNKPKIHQKKNRCWLSHNLKQAFVLFSGGEEEERVLKRFLPFTASALQSVNNGEEVLADIRRYFIGAVEKIPLLDGASQFNEDVFLFTGFNAFGDDLRIGDLCNAGDHFDDLLVFR